MTEETTNPVDGEAMPEVADAPASENDELESTETNQNDETTDEDGSREDDDLEDVELDGETYRLPRKLKDAVLRQADYTRKTQEVAEQRKAVEAQRAQIEKAAANQAEFVQDIANLGALNAQIGRYEGLNWQEHLARNGPQAQADWIEFQNLTRQRDQFTQSITTKVQQREAEQQREAAKLIEQGRAELAKRIKGYSPDVANKLADFGTQFGFSRDEILQAESDPRSIEVLHLAYIGQQALSQQKTAQRVQQQQGLKPVKTVTAKSPPPQGLSDRLGTDAWMERRSQEIRKANR